VDLYVVLLLQLFNTPGDEIAPGSYVVGEDLHDLRLGHDTSLGFGVDASKFGRDGSDGKGEVGLGGGMAGVPQCNGRRLL
jgi:hypothetical protein